MKSRLEDALGFAITVGPHELLTHLSIAHQRQALLRHRGPREVTAETLHFVAFSRPGCGPECNENPAILPIRRLTNRQSPSLREESCQVHSPQSVIFVDELPHNTTGKVFKRELRATHIR